MTNRARLNNQRKKEGGREKRKREIEREKKKERERRAFTDLLPSRVSGRGRAKERVRASSFIRTFVRSLVLMEMWSSRALRIARCFAKQSTSTVSVYFTDCCLRDLA
jgi:hypothetical protein